ncbi:hypothetical protein ESCOCK400B_19410 [Escherichia coli]|nr:hypothetical protein QREC_QR7375_04934 [Escherichia coli]SRB31586.1 Uncharacterised protein [Escherichia coli]
MDCSHEIGQFMLSGYQSLGLVFCLTQAFYLCS